MSESRNPANRRSWYERNEPEFWEWNAKMIDHAAFANASRRYAEKLRRG